MSKVAVRVRCQIWKAPLGLGGTGPDVKVKMRIAQPSSGQRSRRPAPAPANGKCIHTASASTRSERLAETPDICEFRQAVCNPADRSRFRDDPQGAVEHGGGRIRPARAPATSSAHQAAFAGWSPKPRRGRLRVLSPLMRKQGRPVNDSKLNAPYFRSRTPSVGPVVALGLPRPAAVFRRAHGRAEAELDNPSSQPPTSQEAGQPSQDTRN